MRYSLFDHVMWLMTEPVFGVLMEGTPIALPSCSELSNLFSSVNSEILCSVVWLKSSLLTDNDSVPCVLDRDGNALVVGSDGDGVSFVLVGGDLERSFCSL